MHPYTRYFPVRATDDCLDLNSILHAGLTKASSRHLMSFEGIDWDVARVSALVVQIQNYFAEKGVIAGSRVAVMARNDPLHIALIYAMALSGIVWVPINVKLKATGIEYVLQHCNPRMLIVDSAFESEATLACTPTALIEIVAIDAIAGSAHRSDTASAIFASSTPRRIDVDPQHLLCIIYTSGTTGPPKGVLFSHRMMRIASESARIAAGVRTGDRLFLWEPLCHIGGAQMLLVPFLDEVTLVAVSGFSASKFWGQVISGRCTHVHYLGGILDILMRQPASDNPATHPLRVGWGAGVSASAWPAMRERFGFALRECYGMTEGSSFATFNQTDTPGSIGRPMSWLKVELLGEDDQPVPCGELGQIVLSSEVQGIFLSAYLDNPEATANMLRNGKLYTGDIARADAEGNYYFVGRQTDSMRVRGENVSAWEIERVVLNYPGIRAAAAVGVTSEVGEQEVLLYVNWQGVKDGSLAALSQWLADKLASFQVPRFYATVDRFELTPSERVRKHLLARDPTTAWDRLTG